MALMGRLPTLLLSTLVLLFALVGRAACQTEAEKEAVERNVDTMDSILNRTSTAMNSIVRSEAPPGADGRCANGRPLQFACGRHPGPTQSRIDFSKPLPPTVDYVQVKQYAGSTMSNASMQARLCSITRLGETWNETRAEGHGNVLYQYFAGAQNNFGSYPPVTWNCSASYVPTERPYYVAGATGQKDLAILIDVSSASIDARSRLAIAKAAAVKLLRSLSFRDYVAVFPFAETVNTTLTPAFVQATYDNVAALTQAVQRIELAPAGTLVNLGTATETAVKELGEAREQGRSSGCTQAMVLLVSNGTDTGADDPLQPLRQDGDVIAFVVQITPRAAVPVTTRLKSIACVSQGTAATVSRVEDSGAAVSLVNTYFSSILINDVVRWSEGYTDQFGQGQILSGALPLYGQAAESGATVLEGLVVMDVPLANFSLSGALTATQVNSLILSRQVCTPLDQRGSGAEQVAKLQDGLCDGVNTEAAPATELALRKAEGWLKFASVVAMLLCVVGPLLVYRSRARIFMDTVGAFETGRRAFLIALLLTVATFVCWVIFLSIFWTNTFADVVAVTSYDKVLITATAHKQNAYRCCVTTDCRCASYNGPASCGALIARQEEGTCGNGYACCERTCRECHCRTRRSKHGRHRTCSTCCSCSVSVSNVQCSVACGTCYRPTVTVSYTYKGVPTTVQLVASCGINDYSCVEAWFAPYPIGRAQEAFVDPGSPRTLFRNVRLRTNFFVPVCIFGFLAVVLPLVSIAVTLVRANRVSRYSAPSPGMNAVVGGDPVAAPLKEDPPVYERASWETPEPVVPTAMKPL